MNFSNKIFQLLNWLNIFFSLRKIKFFHNFAVFFVTWFMAFIFEALRNLCEIIFVVYLGLLESRSRKMMFFNWRFFPKKVNFPLVLLFFYYLNHGLQILQLWNLCEITFVVYLGFLKSRSRNEVLQLKTFP